MLPIGWEQINLLLNVSKSNLLLFNVGNQPQTKFEIFIDHDEQLKQKEYAKYLGIFIDNKLSWKKNMSKLLILKQRNSHNMQNAICLQEKQLRNMYNAFIKPCLEYGSLTWGGVGGQKNPKYNR